MMKHIHSAVAPLLVILLDKTITTMILDRGEVTDKETKKITTSIHI